MKKSPFRVAFVGVDSPQGAALLACLSPLILPVPYRDWPAFQDGSTPFSPELVAVWPGTEGPPFKLGVPCLLLGFADVDGAVGRLEALLLASPGRLCPPAPENRLLGGSAAMAKVRGLLVATAKNTLPLLLTGENGTGKDLAANVAHALSCRADQPFVAVNCGAVPVGLAETEFFGCVRGSFTGAETRMGFCQQALGGTLFLDEIGELVPEVQAKLLRVLENGEIRRLGSSRLETADFRLICATNRDLAAEVKARRFREDLYYRVNVLAVKLPALRERLEDLPLLCACFLGSATLALERPVRVGSRALAKLAAYSWPGNLRQLRNVLLRAAVLHQVEELLPEHLEWDS
jgi:two-component system response regulator PilR (NtrC family)